MLASGKPAGVNRLAASSGRRILRHVRPLTLMYRSALRNPEGGIIQARIAVRNRMVA
jgi:hypothetical protein